MTLIRPLGLELSQKNIWGNTLNLETIIIEDNQLDLLIISTDAIQGKTINALIG